MSLKILLQRIQLTVQRHRQADGSRRHQVTDVFCTVVVCLVFDPEKTQEYNGKDDGKQHRVHQRMFDFLFQNRAGAVKEQRNEYAKKS